jgi:hypothetical protein
MDGEGRVPWCLPNSWRSLLWKMENTARHFLSLEEEVSEEESP